MRDLVVFLASQAVLCRAVPQQRHSSLFVVIRLSFYSAPSLKLVAEFRLSLHLRIISCSNIFVWVLLMSVAALSMTSGEAHRL
ncbi:hypothetical protein LIPSTDRAFT_74587 [Lipomyces starkeyi NRRL Y-11557]|uniref:Uncharacterized protein n=1 Tax=Lipomyces starkeyi NRRL Y-11557 TaxID=675824 RepID=A0A1E3PY13_LIPST|nr:hypothetical protein LIPSTDRAFT_74587 [Lipomyces starkeyi NRRL Y-11557]